MASFYVIKGALGGYVVAELNDQGQASKRYVYAGGRRLAEHETQGGVTSVRWQHKNAATATHV